jgi:hypothetical protein
MGKTLEREQSIVRVPVLIDGEEEAQKALHGELAEVAAQHPGDIGPADTEQGGGLDLFHSFMQEIATYVLVSRR